MTADLTPARIEELEWLFRNEHQRACSNCEGSSVELADLLALCRMAREAAGLRARVVELEAARDEAYYGMPDSEHLAKLRSKP